MENENQILLLLGEIKGQVGTFIAGLADVNKRSDDHEERIRTLENKGSKQAGMLAGLMLAASALATGISFIAHLIWK